MGVAALGRCAISHVSAACGRRACSRTPGGRGGTGRHARLRISWPWPWGFEFPSPAPGPSSGRTDSGSGRHHAGPITYRRIEMQVTELSAEGLKREYKIAVPADEIADRVASRLQRAAADHPHAGIPAGQGAAAAARKQYGRSVMGEVLEEAVDQGARQAIEDRQLRPALRPKVEVTSFDEGADLEFTGRPRGPARGAGGRPQAGPQLTKLVAEVRRDPGRAGAGRPARSAPEVRAPRRAAPDAGGRRLIIDFEGRVDGEPFEGGSAKDFTARAGQPDHGAGLRGPADGRRRPATARTSPSPSRPSFPRAELAGKEAVIRRHR